MAKGFWLPFTCALLLIGAIELGIQGVMQPGLWDKSTWLLHDPYRGEQFDRLIVKEKIEQVLEQKPDIISVGDSSGLFSIQPLIVNRFLRGLKYASLSTGANQAFDGYRAIMIHALDHQPSVKYVVLNMYPNLVPSPEVFRKADLAPILYDNLVGAKAYLTPPSAALSPYAKWWFFYGMQFDPKALTSSHKVFLESHFTFAQTLGWVPEHDVRFSRTRQTTPMFPDRETGAGRMFGLFERSAILTTLREFAEDCRKRGVTLMIMFNPMSWSTIEDSGHLREAEQLLEQFQRENPDVVFLTDRLVELWEPAKFGMYNHVSRDFVHESSERMGSALEKAIYRPEKTRPFRAGWTPANYPITEEVTVLGKATDAQKQAALAYYLYTCTGDSDLYLPLLSARVRTALGSSRAFQWMMEDTQARTQALEAKKIALTYDASLVDAHVVQVKNGYTCGSGSDVTWIRLSGVMQFGFRSPVQQSSEAVQWPQSAGIFVPLIREGGQFVYDGYCPAKVETYSEAKPS